MFTGKEWAAIAASYFWGCGAMGYYWVRWRTGQDLRQLGSGSLGARNAGRVLGVWGFSITLAADLAKGALAVGLARLLGLSGEAVVAVIVAVVAGHNWPVQLRFQGGKGVATSVGALLTYNPLLGIVLTAVFLPAFALGRNFILSGLLAYALSPLLVLVLGLGNEAVAAVSLPAVLVLLSHRKNIREELAGVLPGRPVKEPPSQPR